MNTARQCCKALCNLPWQPGSSPTSSGSLLERAVPDCVGLSCTYASRAEFAHEEQFMLSRTPMQCHDWVWKSELYSVLLTQGKVWKPCQRIAVHW